MKKFMTDDYLLFFAVIVLVGATGLAFTSMPHQYDLLAVLLEGADPTLLFSVEDEIPTIAKVENAASTLWWFVIVPVKLAFLFFFRRMLLRIRDLRIWRDCVIVFAILSGLTCVAATWLTCLYFTINGMLCKSYCPNSS